MPKVTLYLPDEENDLLEEAKRALGADASLSSLFRESLRRIVAEFKAAKEGVQRVELPLFNALTTDGGVVFSVIEMRPVAFTGKLLFREDAEHGWYKEVYRTARGKLLFYFGSDRPQDHGASYEIYESLDQATRAMSQDDPTEERFERDFLQRVSEALGEPWVQELDI